MTAAATTKRPARKPTKRTPDVKQWDRFRPAGHCDEKLLVLWVKSGKARVLDEKRGWCTNKSIVALSKYRRLGRCVRPRLHKVHKFCACCKTTVYVRADVALRMARAEARR